MRQPNWHEDYTIKVEQVAGPPYNTWQAQLRDRTTGAVVQEGQIRNDYGTASDDATSIVTNMQERYEDGE